MIQPFLQLKAGRIWPTGSIVWGQVRGRHVDIWIRRQNDLMNLQKLSKKQTVKKKCQQTNAKFREIRINVSLGVISGKTHIAGWMFLPFSFRPLLFCSHNQKWSSPFPGLNSISHHVSSWHLTALTGTFWALPRLFALPEEGLLSAESMKPVSNSTVLPILWALYCCMCLRKWELFSGKYWGTTYTPLLQVVYALGWSHLHGNLK